MAAATRVEIARILLLHVRRQARVEQPQHIGLAYPGQSPGQGAEHAGSEVFDDLDAYPRIEGLPQRSHIAHDIVGMAAVFRRREQLDTVERIRAGRKRRRQPDVA